jgi:hypothetical protein
MNFSSIVFCSLVIVADDALDLFEDLLEEEEDPPDRPELFLALVACFAIVKFFLG